MRLKDYGVIFPKWKRHCSQEWSNYIQHDFVKGLCDGSLVREKYLNYLIQDYIFLIHFSRAWALAVTKTDSPEEMRLCASVLNSLVNEEIQLHVETCLREGLSEKKIIGAAEEPENIAYTRYVLDVGHQGDFIDLLAALAPCVMGYGEIGINLKSYKSSDNYAEWINVYSGEDYQRSCFDTANLIDQAVKVRLGDNPENTVRWPSLCKKFKQATILESAFWDMALR